MRVKKKNLIVTCGTSQIQKNKYASSAAADKGALLEYIDRFVPEKWDETTCDLDFLDTKEVGEWAEKFAAVCLRGWENRAEWVGVRNNILGAELNTLVAMEKEGGVYAWDPAQTVFHLIASQSKSGLFAARMVKEVLARGWQIDPARISIEMVPGFNQNSSQPDQALYHLANVVARVLKQDRKDDPWENVFVSSGGFKTSLPLLTVYSFLFGITMVNTYEFSTRLQRLSPRIDMDNQQSRRFWSQTWERLNRQKWMADETSRYLQFIMDFRVENKDADF